MGVYMLKHGAEDATRLDLEPGAPVIWFPTGPHPVALFTALGTFVTATGDAPNGTIDASSRHLTRATEWIFRTQNHGQWSIESAARRTYVHAGNGYHGSVRQNAMVNSWERFHIVVMGANDTIGLWTTHGSFIRADETDRLTARSWTAHPLEPPRFRVVMASDGALLPPVQFPFPRHRVVLRHAASNTVLGVVPDTEQAVVPYDAAASWSTHKWCQWTLWPNDRNDAYQLKHDDKTWLSVNTKSGYVCTTTSSDYATTFWVILLEAPGKIALAVASTSDKWTPKRYLSVHTPARGVRECDTGEDSSDDERDDDDDSDEYDDSDDDEAAERRINRASRGAPSASDAYGRRVLARIRIQPATETWEFVIVA
ncbi:hypothetical protein AMAG_00798 [Allomyces macrogynus ATCC 38327]|uniref:Uncharacterized protein n=1 Tax=Allomyces macrogynus (strain ATCC 38327) TaxID=578462 RepID=A0A0L0RWX5_ALLM3|nr:hypothetical protein AMAG_00798 [Allomyces macrogynus ATCC 38327]|eukprot:KNE54848.1 hypothetical protein AMAG_00798 [Allomyces macrogynus ATCC 38327]